MSSVCGVRGVRVISDHVSAGFCAKKNKKQKKRSFSEFFKATAGFKSKDFPRSVITFYWRLDKLNALTLADGLLVKQRNELREPDAEVFKAFAFSLFYYLLKL